MTTEAKTDTNDAIESGHGFYEPYAEYAGTLRNWLIAYGVGGLAIFVTNKDAWETVTTKGHAKDVALWFIGGIAAQVILAFLNKVVMWIVYYGEENEEFTKSLQYRVSHWLSTMFVVDVVLDLGAMVAFGVATYYLFKAFGC